MTCSIFMDSMTSSGWCTWTASPAVTSIATTVPCIGASMFTVSATDVFYNPHHNARASDHRDGGGTLGRCDGSQPRPRTFWTKTSAARTLITATATADTTRSTGPLTASPSTERRLARMSTKVEDDRRDEPVEHLRVDQQVDEVPGSQRDGGADDDLRR